MLYAEHGATPRADETFARARYHGVSPFPIAMLDFQRGRMWLVQGEPELARCWLAAACQRLPSYVPAQGLLAAAVAVLGEHDAAIARPRPLTRSSDDPDDTAQRVRAPGADHA